MCITFFAPSPQLKRELAQKCMHIHAKDTKLIYSVYFPDNFIMQLIYSVQNYSRISLYFQIYLSQKIDPDKTCLLSLSHVTPPILFKIKSFETKINLTSFHYKDHVSFTQFISNIYSPKE